MTGVSKCELSCVEESYGGKEVHAPIALADGVPIVIGRSPDTLIKDKRCSRQQIKLTADWSSRTIKVEQLGAVASAIGESILEKGQTVTIRSTDIIYVVGKEFPHRVTFQTLTSDEPDKKRTRLETSDNESSEDEKLQELEAQLQWMKRKQAEGKPDKMDKDTTEGALVETADSWSQHKKLLVFKSRGLSSSHKIAAYDVDGTIITTASGKVFAVDANDWKILYAEIPGKLKSLNKEGYKIVFFTNQLGVEKGKITEADIKRKLENIVKRLGVPVQIFVSTSRGQYRKPQPGMWDLFVTEGNNGVKPTVAESFYVGDAAGRPAGWSSGKKKDHSCSDRLFALNVGLKFFTPEEHFMSQAPAKYNLPEFNPQSLDKSISLTDPADALTSKDQEVIVMCGSPASGKSHFAWSELIPKGYVHVSRDSMGTWQKCVAMCKSALSKGKSVVVDNTNPDLESRHRYIDCAKEFKVKCRCFVMNVTFDHIRHNEKFREVIDPSHEKIADMILYSFRKKYKAPKISDGFDQVVSVNFKPHFTDPDHRRLYNMYLLEK